MKEAALPERGPFLAVTRILLVNELTIFYLLFCIITGRKVWILATLPLFPPTRRILDFFVALLVRKGRIDYAFNHCSELDRMHDYPVKIILYDVFADIESWMNDRFRFNEVGCDENDYALSYKKIVSNYMNAMMQPLLILRLLHQRLPINTYKVIGLPHDLRAAARMYAGSDIVLASGFFDISSKIVNALLALVVMIFSLGWIAVKLRPYKFGKKSYFFAIDYIHDGRDDQMLEELQEAGPQLIVLRHAATNDQLAKLPKGRDICRYSDGVFGLLGGFSAMLRVVRDNLKLWFKHNDCPPVVFFQIAALPFRRNMAKAFFNKFVVSYFWGRDPYNVEHILRRREINRIGGKSLGVSVSFLTTYTILWPQFRYLNYDSYYVFERPIIEQHYANTWPSDMKLIVAGSGLISRDLLSRRSNRRSNDIVVFCGVFIGEPAMLEFIRGLAEAFPDRKILLQLKPYLLTTPAGYKFVDDCMEGISNIVHLTDSPYELILQARYAISDPSSLVAEALQLGSFAFGFDIPSKQKTNILRSYPGLVFASANEMADRIRGIEAKTDTYDLELYSRLVDISGTPFNDRVREEVGLEAIQAPVPLTAKFFEA